MDAATLQNRIYKGYGRAALRIGYTFSIYRPLTASTPISAPNLIGQPLNASFTPNNSGFNFNLTSDYKSSIWHGLFDGTTTQVGDYLYNATHGTYFIAAQQDELPILCVGCDTILTVSRPSGSAVLGVGAYSGTSPATLSPIVTQWPASLIFDARGRGTGANLPMDEPLPYFTALLPRFASTDIRPSDVVVDNLNRRYVVAASDLSALGWRLILQYEAA